MTEIPSEIRNGFIGLLRKSIPHLCKDDPAIDKLIEAAQPDGVLVRNLGSMTYFQPSPLRKIGDFSQSQFGSQSDAL